MSKRSKLEKYFRPAFAENVSVATQRASRTVPLEFAKLAIIGGKLVVPKEVLEQAAAGVSGCSKRGGVTASSRDEYVHISKMWIRLYTTRPMNRDEAQSVVNDFLEEVERLLRAKEQKSQSHHPSKGDGKYINIGGGLNSR